MTILPTCTARCLRLSARRGVSASQFLLPAAIPSRADAPRSTGAPSGLKPRDRRGPYALACDLRKDSEILEALQMEDDAERARAPTASANVLEDRRGSGRRSIRTLAVSKSKSPRVQAYIERRQKQKEERAQVRPAAGSRLGPHGTLLITPCSLIRLAGG